MNILFIHETEYVEKVIFEYQIVPEILASRGHNVFVVDFPSNWKKKNWWDFGGLRTKYLPNTKRANKDKGVTLIRPGFLKIPGIGRLMAALAYWWVIPTVIKKHRIDCIVLYSVPTNGIQTMFWAKRLKVPVFFRLFDVLHQLVPNNLLKKIAYSLEKKVYPQVNALAATTPKLKDYAIAMGAPSNVASYLPTGSDADLFYPAPKNPSLMKKFGIQSSDTVIGFAGTLFNFSELDGLISYIAKHRQELKDVKLIISGRGEQEQSLAELIRVNNLGGQVTLTGFIAYENLANYINLADVCINLFDINGLTRDIIPGKIYQYLACGKPVIATPLPGILGVFPEGDKDHAIFYCNERDFNQLFSIVRRVKGSPVKNSEPSLQQVASEYEKIVKRLVEANNGR